MKVLNDMMLEGPAARAVLNRLIEKPRRRRRPKNSVGRGVVPIFEPFVDSSLSLDPSFEDTSIERIDYERHGDKAGVRFDRDMRRMAAREALPAVIEKKLEMVADEDGKLPVLERIRAAQEGRHIQHLAILRRGQPPTIPAPAPETAPEIADTKPEIVHEPVGDTASPEYVAEQDALEAELARSHPEAYIALFGGRHAALLRVSDVERAQATNAGFDDRMHIAMQRIGEVIRNSPRPRSTFQEASPAPNQQPTRRDSERP